MPITFTDPALDDLRRLGAPVARRTLARIAVLDTDPAAGDDLATIDTGYRKLSAPEGTWRVVYTVDADVVTIWEVWVDGVRSTGAAYAEALQRMVSADAPDAVELARDPRAARSHHRYRPGPTQPHRRTRPRLARRRAHRTHRTHPPRSRRHGRHHRLRSLERPHALIFASPFGH